MSVVEKRATTKKCGERLLSDRLKGEIATQLETVHITKLRMKAWEESTPLLALMRLEEIEARLLELEARVLYIASVL